ncbi:uncharacterized protein [Procambarus clarkii]|uniref:uncharacterized protein n=1 Tax=Procambarus clarkii TaxID=6728 RepID=UPI0037436145
MGVGVLEAVQEEEVATLEEARRSLAELRDRNKAQSHLLVAWKRRLKEQNLLMLHLQRERDSHLRTIQAQLLLFESQLRRRQKEVEALLQQKDATIHQQQHIILYLSRALNANQKARHVLQTSNQNTKEQISKIPSDKEAQDDENTQNKDNQTTGLLITSTKSDPESLNDSDSAIMLEDNFDFPVLIPMGKGEVKVVRSVSDAVEAANRSSCSTAISAVGTSTASVNSALLAPGFSSGTGPGSLSTSPSCSSEESDDSPACTLTKGRAELLRTVYSLEEEEICHAHQEHDSLLEDTVSPTPSLVPSVTPSLQSILKVTSHYDSDATLSDGESEDEEEDIVPHFDDSASDRRRLLGSYEKLNTLGAAPKKVKAEEEIQVTYNRVMSNHRSVTKPKDVKYRRINKAKSRSLEELRGKLKYWTDRGGKQSLSVDLDNHSYA